MGNNDNLNAEIDAQAKAMGLDESDLTGEAGGSFEQPLNHNLDSQEEEDSSEQPQPQEDDKKGKQDQPQNEDDEDDEEEEEEEGKKGDEPNPQKDKAKDAFKQRQGKRRQEMEEFKSEVRASMSELTNLVKQVISPKASTEDKKEAQADYKAKLKEIAEKNGMEEADMQSLMDAMAEGIGEKLGISSDKVQDMMEAASYTKQKKAEDHDKEEQQIFENEWKDAIPNIRKVYPNATDEQIQKAKELMDDLSHSENYGKTDKHPPMPLDYILFKEGEKFKEILFSPKKKTAEGSNLGDWEAPQGDPLNFNFENLTPESAKKAEEEIDALYGKK